MKSDTIIALLSEHAHSCTKHGTWQDYTIEQAIKAVESEIRELQGAIAQNHLEGRDSVLMESLQVANVALKLYERVQDIIAESK